MLEEKETIELHKEQVKDVLCGRCNKPKEGDNRCKCGRPNEFKEEYIEKVDEYLKANQDEKINVVKQKSNGQGKGYEIYDTKLKVSLPTVEGFALYLNVSKRSLYTWSEENPKFLHALDKIRTEQKKRLLDNGLSGDYNSTIAKLVLSSNHGMSEKREITGEVKTTFILQDDNKKTIDNAIEGISEDDNDTTE